MIIYCKPHSGDDVESFGAQWVKCLSQGLLGGGVGGGLGSRGGQPALYKYNMADLATHHTHKQNSHCEGKQKKRKSGGEGVPREGRRGGGVQFSSVCKSSC